jgi:hypothetical protein
MAGSCTNRRCGEGRWKMLAVLLVCCACDRVLFHLLRGALRLAGDGEPQLDRCRCATRALDGLHGGGCLRLKGGGCCLWAAVHVAKNARKNQPQRSMCVNPWSGEGRLDRVWLVNDLQGTVADALVTALAGASILRGSCVLSRWLGLPKPFLRTSMWLTLLAAG